MISNNRIFNLLWLTPTFFYEKRNIISVKRKIQYSLYFPKSAMPTSFNLDIKSNSPQGFSRLFPCPSLWTPHSPQTKADFSIGGRTLSVAEHPNKTVDTFNSPVMDCRVATSERIKGQVGTKDSSELTLIHLFFIPVPIPVLLLPISNF